MAFSAVFFDLDDTILDFARSEAEALSRALREEGLPAGEETLARYHRINAEQWAMLERGETTRKRLLSRRFSLLFDSMGVGRDPEAFCRRYQEYLGQEAWFVPGAEALLKTLAPRYALYLASNGTADTQYSRLAAAGIRGYFQRIFVSQEMGADKPSGAFFDACFAALPGLSRQEVLMVGDSLTSDIRGGKNAGLATCWYNPRRETCPPELRPDFEMRALSELPGILARE